MHRIHPNARATPAVRAEIARSPEPSGLLAQRYGVSAETIRKWRQRGAADCLDRSARPHTLPWQAAAEERVVVCAPRQSTNFALDDLTVVVMRFLPHLSRDSISPSQGRGAQPAPSDGLGTPGQGSGAVPG
jgi:transposase-like protein